MIYRKSKSGRIRKIKDTWVVMRNGEPKASHTYMGGAIGIVHGESGLDGDLHWDETRRDGNKIILLTAEEPDGTYWEVMRTALNPIKKEYRK